MTTIITDPVQTLKQAQRTVKLFTGVGNNAAIGVMRDCHDRVKQHRRYNNGSVKREFVRTFKEWERYLHRLRYEKGGYFGMEKMTDAERKRYGDTDADKMLDMWQGMGAKLQAQTWPLVTSLWNKFRLSLEERHIADADAVAWSLSAQTALDIAEELYDMGIRDCRNQGIPPGIVRKVFSVFSMKRVADCWRRAMYMLEPITKEYDTAKFPERNVAFGLQQLVEAWTTPENILDSAIDTPLYYEEYFRTRGEMKKASREWGDVKANYLKELGEMKARHEDVGRSQRPQ